MRTGRPTIPVPADDRNIFRHIVYCSIMENRTNKIKDKCVEMLAEKKMYIKGDLAYLRYLMKEAPQEKLAKDLNTLTMKELKIAIAAGVWGRCQRLALNLLANYKDKMEAYLDADGNKATLTVESLDDE